MPDPRFCAHCLALPSIPSELPLHITRAALSHRTSWLQEFSSSGPEFIGSFPIHPLSQPLEGSKEREGHAAELDEKKAGLHWPASGLGQNDCAGSPAREFEDMAVLGSRGAPSMQKQLSGLNHAKCHLPPATCHQQGGDMVPGLGRGD
ncbi:uncharacterized protein LOC113908237 isoform X2 [Zalophus californianus]|uniref:Uncharacterized protein LOC113908237 isoform X2 n=1 Tax=Zalophus californianus TaxID=9704 RepID=A0A6J2B2Z7_ZALCA|nr:uncharacterized protein LOC113908237 isoform X2 [Zalophus californianus]